MFDPFSVTEVILSRSSLLYSIVSVLKNIRSQKVNFIGLIFTINTVFTV